MSRQFALYYFSGRPAIKCRLLQITSEVSDLQSYQVQTSRSGLGAAAPGRLIAHQIATVSGWAKEVGITSLVGRIRHSPSVYPVSGQRLRRWPDTEWTLGSSLCKPCCFWPRGRKPGSGKEMRGFSPFPQPWNAPRPTCLVVLGRPGSSICALLTCLAFSCSEESIHMSMATKNIEILFGTRNLEIISTFLASVVAKVWKSRTSTIRVRIRLPKACKGWHANALTW